MTHKTNMKNSEKPDGNNVSLMINKLHPDFCRRPPDSVAAQQTGNHGLPSHHSFNPVTNVLNSKIYIAISLQ